MSIEIINFTNAWLSPCIVSSLCLVVRTTNETADNRTWKFDIRPVGMQLTDTVWYRDHTHHKQHRTAYNGDDDDDDDDDSDRTTRPMC